MWHIISIGNDAIEQMSKVYREFYQNESIKKMNPKSLFIDTDPSVRSRFLKDLPNDCHILCEEEQRHSAASQSIGGPVEEAFQKEYDNNKLRETIYKYFAENADIEKISGILFVANIGDETGGVGLIKLLEFFEHWRADQSLQDDFKSYLNYDKIPRYTLIIFPETTRFGGMQLQLQQNIARETFQTLKRFRQENHISGMVLFDRAVKLKKNEFDTKFGRVIRNLILLEAFNNITKNLLSSCSTVSHVKFDISTKLLGPGIEVLNYTNGGRHYQSNADGFTIKQAADLACREAFLNFELSMKPLVFLPQAKINALHGKIFYDNDAFRAQYGNDLNIDSPDYSTTIDNDIIEGVNFIKNIHEYEPYEDKYFIIVVLDTNHEEFMRSVQIKNVRNKLKEIGINFLAHEPGSVVLKLKGSLEKFNVLVKRFESEKRKIVGIPITKVSYKPAPVGSVSQMELWKKNEFDKDKGWRSYERTLGAKASSVRSSPVIKRARKIEISPDHTVVLDAEILEKPNSKTDIVMRVYPHGDETYLPSGLKFISLSESDEIQYKREIKPGEKSDRLRQRFNNYKAGQSFGVRIELGDEQVTHYFVI